MVDFLKDMHRIKITQLKTGIGRPKTQRKVMLALGLSGVGKQVVHDPSSSILGMVAKVDHLILVEKV
jgi:large subunit ribosomal protein L30